MTNMIRMMRRMALMALMMISTVVALTMTATKAAAQTTTLTLKVSGLSDPTSAMLAVWTSAASGINYVDGQEIDLVSAGICTGSETTQSEVASKVATAVNNGSAATKSYPCLTYTSITNFNATVSVPTSGDDLGKLVLNYTGNGSTATITYQVYYGGQYMYDVKAQTTVGGSYPAIDGTTDGTPTTMAAYMTYDQDHLSKLPYGIIGVDYPTGQVTGNATVVLNTQYVYSAISFLPTTTRYTTISQWYGFTIGAEGKSLSDAAVSAYRNYRSQNGMTDMTAEDVKAKELRYWFDQNNTIVIDPTTEPELDHERDNPNGDYLDPQPIGYSWVMIGNPYNFRIMNRLAGANQYLRWDEQGKFFTFDNTGSTFTAIMNYSVVPGGYIETDEAKITKATYPDRGAQVAPIVNGACVVLREGNDDGSMANPYEGNVWVLSLDGGNATMKQIEAHNAILDIDKYVYIGSMDPEVKDMTYTINARYADGTAADNGGIIHDETTYTNGSTISLATTPTYSTVTAIAQDGYTACISFEEEDHIIYVTYLSTTSKSDYYYLRNTGEWEGYLVDDDATGAATCDPRRACLIYPVYAGRTSGIWNGKSYESVQTYYIFENTGSYWTMTSTTTSPANAEKFVLIKKNGEAAEFNTSTGIITGTSYNIVPVSEFADGSQAMEFLSTIYSSNSSAEGYGLGTAKCDFELVSYKEPVAVTLSIQKSDEAGNRSAFTANDYVVWGVDQISNGQSLYTIEDDRIVGLHIPMREVSGNPYLYVYNTNIQNHLLYIVYQQCQYLMSSLESQPVGYVSPYFAVANATGNGFLTYDPDEDAVHVIPEGGYEVAGSDMARAAYGEPLSLYSVNSQWRIEKVGDHKYVCQHASGKYLAADADGHYIVSNDKVTLENCAYDAEQGCVIIEARSGQQSGIHCGLDVTQDEAPVRSMGDSGDKTHWQIIISATATLYTVKCNHEQGGVKLNVTGDSYSDGDQFYYTVALTDANITSLLSPVILSGYKTPTMTLDGTTVTITYEQEITDGTWYFMSPSARLSTMQQYYLGQDFHPATNQDDYGVVALIDAGTLSSDRTVSLGKRVTGSSQYNPVTDPNADLSSYMVSRTIPAGSKQYKIKYGTRNADGTVTDLGYLKFKTGAATTEGGDKFEFTTYADEAETFIFWASENYISQYNTYASANYDYDINASYIIPSSSLGTTSKPVTDEVDLFYGQLFLNFHNFRSGGDMSARTLGLSGIRDYWAYQAYSEASKDVLYRQTQQTYPFVFTDVDRLQTYTVVITGDDTGEGAVRYGDAVLQDGDTFVGADITTDMLRVKPVLGTHYTIAIEGSTVRLTYLEHSYITDLSQLDPAHHYTIRSYVDRGYMASNIGKDNDVLADANAVVLMGSYGTPGDNTHDVDYQPEPIDYTNSDIHWIFTPNGYNAPDDAICEKMRGEPYYFMQNESSGRFIGNYYTSAGSQKIFSTQASLDPQYGVVILKGSDVIPGAPEGTFVFANEIVKNYKSEVKWSTASNSSKYGTGNPTTSEQNASLCGQDFEDQYRWSYAYATPPATGFGGNINRETANYGSYAHGDGKFSRICDNTYIWQDNGAPFETNYDNAILWYIEDTGMQGTEPWLNVTFEGLVDDPVLGTDISLTFKQGASGSTRDVHFEEIKDFQTKGITPYVSSDYIAANGNYSPAIVCTKLSDEYKDGFGDPTYEWTDNHNVTITFVETAAHVIERAKNWLDIDKDDVWGYNDDNTAKDADDEGVYGWPVLAERQTLWAAVKALQDDVAANPDGSDNTTSLINALRDAIDNYIRPEVSINWPNATSPVIIRNKASQLYNDENNTGKAGNVLYDPIPYDGQLGNLATDRDNAPGAEWCILSATDGLFTIQNANGYLLQMQTQSAFATGHPEWAGSFYAIPYGADDIEGTVVNDPDPENGNQHIIATPTETDTSVDDAANYWITELYNQDASYINYMTHHVSGEDFPVGMDQVYIINKNHTMWDNDSYDASTDDRTSWNAAYPWARLGGYESIGLYTGGLFQLPSTTTVTVDANNLTTDFVLVDADSFDPTSKTYTPLDFYPDDDTKTGWSIEVQGPLYGANIYYLNVHFSLPTDYYYEKIMAEYAEVQALIDLYHTYENYYGYPSKSMLDAMNDELNTAIAQVEAAYPSKNLDADGYTSLHTQLQERISEGFASTDIKLPQAGDVITINGIINNGLTNEQYMADMVEAYSTSYAAAIAAGKTEAEAESIANTDMIAKRMEDYAQWTFNFIGQQGGQGMFDQDYNASWQRTSALYVDNRYNWIVRQSDKANYYYLESCYGDGYYLGYNGVSTVPTYWFFAPGTEFGRISLYYYHPTSPQYVGSAKDAHFGYSAETGDEHSYISKTKVQDYEVASPNTADGTTLMSTDFLLFNADVVDITVHIKGLEDYGQTTYVYARTANYIGTTKGTDGAHVYVPSYYAGNIESAPTNWFTAQVVDGYDSEITYDNSTHELTVTYTENLDLMKQRAHDYLINAAKLTALYDTTNFGNEDDTSATGLTPEGGYHYAIANATTIAEIMGYMNEVCKMAEGKTITLTNKQSSRLLATQSGTLTGSSYLNTVEASSVKNQSSEYQLIYVGGGTQPYYQLYNVVAGNYVGSYSTSSSRFASSTYVSGAATFTLTATDTNEFYLTDVTNEVVLTEEQSNHYLTAVSAHTNDADVWGVTEVTGATTIPVNGNYYYAANTSGDIYKSSDNSDAKADNPAYLFECSRSGTSFYLQNMAGGYLQTDGSIADTKTALTLEQVEAFTWNIQSVYSDAYETLLQTYRQVCEVPFGTTVGTYAESGKTAVETAKTTARTALKEEASGESDQQSAYTDLVNSFASVQLNMPAAGFYRLKNVHTGKYLTMSGAKEDVAAPVKNIAEADVDTDAPSIFYFESDDTSVGVNTNEGITTLATNYSSETVTNYTKAKLLGYSNGLYIYATNNPCYAEFKTNAREMVICGHPTELCAYRLAYPLGTSGYEYMGAEGSYTSNYAATGDNAVAVNGNTEIAWTLEPVTQIPVTVTAAGIATLCLPVPVTIPTGVTAGYGESTTQPGTDAAAVGLLNVTTITGDVAASTPIIIEAAEGTYQFPIASSGTSYTTVMTGLMPTTIKSEAENSLGTGQKIYVLMKGKVNGTETLGFFGDYIGNLTGFKAYLKYNSSNNTAGARPNAFLFNWDTADGINTIYSDQCQDTIAPVFNLQGIYMGEKLRGLPCGVYIQNGRKVTVK